MAYDPCRPDVNRKEVIQWTYHLSVRESELACALAGGGSLETYAGRADCSLESARSLLKRIFRKTGTSRQSELVKLVLAGPAAMVQ
jgi:DNA-binding CsgD family transcriptional regulator